MKILLLEDDAILHDIIAEFLIESGYDVDRFYDGEKALDAIGEKRYDLLLLDVNVPGIDGFEILSYLREIGNSVPAIYMTALSGTKSLKKGFESGADDYLKKPFELEELGIRIEHALKSRRLEEEIALGKIRFFPKRHLLKVGDRSVQMRQKEAQVLAYFVQNRDRVVSCDEIIENVWHDDQMPSYATIRTYIKNLRRLLGEKTIENIKGEGYRFNIV